MAFDFKKEYKEFYMPKNKPTIVTVPPMNYLAVRGHGDPNEEGGEYKEAIGLLYGIAFTIKMSKKGSRQIEGFFDYVVPPLEGFWWQDGVAGVDYAHKENFNWISVIRLPDFVTKDDFDWAIEEATRKKKTDFSKVEFLQVDEGLCVPIMVPPVLIRSSISHFLTPRISVTSIPNSASSGISGNIPTGRSSPWEIRPRNFMVRRRKPSPIMSVFR